MYYLCEDILTIEKCFAMAENTEITPVVLQTSKKTSITSHVKTKEESEQIKFCAILLIKALQGVREHLGLLPL